MMFINFKDIAILNISCVDFCCIINGINKSETVNLLENTNFSEKVDHYTIKFFFIVYKR